MPSNIGFSRVWKIFMRQLFCCPSIWGEGGGSAPFMEGLKVALSIFNQRQDYFYGSFCRLWFLLVHAIFEIKLAKWFLSLSFTFVDTDSNHRPRPCMWNVFVSLPHYMGFPWLGFPSHISNFTYLLKYCNLQNRHLVLYFFDLVICL